MDGVTAPSGNVAMRVIAREKAAPVAWKIRNLPHRLRGEIKLAVARIMRIPHFHGCLKLRLITSDGIVDYGVVSRRVVTTAGVNYIVDAFQNTTELENMKFHGFGTGGAAEAVGNTALTTELTTQYVVDNTRPTGTTAEGASANIYQTVATLDPDATVAITEHGIFSASTAGTLLDRSLFSTINLNATGDTLEATYELTFAAGG